MLFVLLVSFLCRPPRPLANGTASAQPLLTPSCLSPVPAERCAPALRRAESAPRHRLATATPSPPHKAVADMTDAEKLDCIAAGIAPACGTRYVELSAAVFGGAVPVRPGEPGTRTGRKILRAPLKGPALMEWYMPAGGPDSHFQSEKRMRWKAKQDAMREAVKGAPKK